MADSLNTVERCGLSFAKLSVNDRAKILKAAKVVYKQDHESSLKSAASDGDRTYVELSVIDKEMWGYGRWIQLLNSFDGQIAVLGMSLHKANPSEDVEVLLSSVILEIEETIEHCCKITGTPHKPPTSVPQNMKQVGVLDGQPIYVAVDGKPPETVEGDRPLAYGATGTEGEENPTPARKGYGS